KVDIDDPNSHPIHAVSWSPESTGVTIYNSFPVNIFKFTLRTPQLNYELLPHTTYTLRLNGGSDGVEFICQKGSLTPTQHYLDPSGYQMMFITGDDLVAPAITDHSYMTTHNTAVLGWITSEPALTKIRYG